MTTRHPAGVVALVLTLISVVASCSNDDDNPPTATVSEPDLVTTTDEMTTTSTSPPTTSTTTTTTSAPSTTTSTTTSTTSTTTVAPEVALAQAVEQDWREANRLTTVAFHDPSDADAVAAALDRRLDPARQTLRERLAENARRNLRTRSEPLAEPALTIESGPEFVDGNPLVVRIQTCEIDPWVLVETGAAPDGGDAVFDDNIYAYRALETLRLDGGVWKISDIQLVQSWTGATQCV